MTTKPKAKGSWGVRFFITILGIILGVLFFWLLNYIEQDIGKIKGLRWEDVRNQYVDASQDVRKTELNEEITTLNRKIQRVSEQQNFLLKSTTGLQNTINQLLSIQKESKTGKIVFSEESLQTLQKSQAVFLENQQKYQETNQQLAELTDQLREKEEQRTAVERQISEQEKPARKTYNLKNGIFRLFFLIPFFLIVSFLFMKFRTTAWWPLVWAVFIAAFIKTAMVVHTYFSNPYLKYIALLVIIAVVIRILVYLIRLIISPKKDLLIKQYQQHYDKCICPVCSKPIRTGPLRYIGALHKKAQVLAGQTEQTVQQEPYTCPSCGTELYDKCDKCGQIRHSLLPYCEHCGTEKSEIQKQEKE